MHAPTVRLISIFLPPLYPLGSADMELSRTIQVQLLFGLASVLTFDLYRRLGWYQWVYCTWARGTGTWWR